MSFSPEQKRDDTSISPKMSPTQGGSITGAIEVTIHSVMDGVKDAKIWVPLDATVFELKRNVCIATEIAPERQLLLYRDKELRDDEAPISYYGIVSSCRLTMNVKMNTGVHLEQKGITAAEMMFLLPMIMPVGNLTHLRTTIRTMTNVTELEPRKIHPQVDESSSKWTPTKQMEHELTRNRMKKLLRKRKRTTILSNTLTPKTPDSVISRSPLEPRSPGEYADVPSPSPQHSPMTSESKELTEKELKPPESLDELFRKKHELFLPPESVAELEEIRRKWEERLKTTCKICGRRLPLPEQQMRCRCRLVFCRKHREPGAHLCQIDYKYTGRSKIIKENPKMDGGGIHKARMSD